VIPGDDRALAELISLHSKRRNSFGPGDRIVQLIESSLGDLQSYSALTRRTAFMAATAALGIRTLKTSIVTGYDPLPESLKELGFPLVLKLDGTSGGTGTVIAYCRQDAIAKSGMLLSPWRRMRKNFGSFLRGEGSLLATPSEWRKPVLNAQTFVNGRPATTAFACLDGKVLGTVHAEVLQEAWPKGPATVVRVIRSGELDSNAEKVASRFRLSGVHGLDYIVEEATGIPWLIEMNPRLTQIAHFALGPGHDLAAALIAASTGEPVPSRSVQHGSEVVALFPQEWLRDRKSPFINSGYDDVPRNNPAFVQAILGKASNSVG